MIIIIIIIIIDNQYTTTQDNIDPKGESDKERI